MPINAALFQKPSTSCEVVSTANAVLLLANLPGCSDFPKEYTVKTITNINPGSTSITLGLDTPNIAGDSVYVRKGFIFQFGSEFIITREDATITFGTPEVIEIEPRALLNRSGLTRQLIPTNVFHAQTDVIVGTNAAFVTAAASATPIIELFPVKSTTDLSTNFNDNTIDITDHNSGLQGQMIKSGFELALPVSYRLRCDDLAIPKVITPGQLGNAPVYFVHSQADPSSCAFFTFGKAILSALNSNAPIKNIVTGTFSLLTQPNSGIVSSLGSLNPLALAEYKKAITAFGLPSKTV